MMQQATAVNGMNAMNKMPPQRSVLIALMSSLMCNNGENGDNNHVEKGGFHVIRILIIIKTVWA